jgi:integrase
MATVGRKRIKDKHLPQRVYIRRGVYYYVSRDGAWKRLGAQYSEALKALAKLVDIGTPVGTIAHLIERYTAEELSGKAAKTRKGRHQEFKPIIACFGHMTAEEIESHHIWTYWMTRGRTEQARHEIRAFSALLTFARRVGARTRPNPCFGLQLPQSRARDRYVTDDEFLFVRERAQPMIGYAMDLALVAGMDEGTIRVLERKNLTDEGIQFERGKTGEFQLIEWNDELDLTVKAILRERPQLRRALICNRKGRAYSPNGFQSQWQRLMRRAVKDGLKERFHFHDLRAKSASDAESDQEAADRLGHGDVKLTRRVYRRLPRRAVALSILDARPISERKPK